MNRLNRMNDFELYYEMVTRQLPGSMSINEPDESIDENNNNNAAAFDNDEYNLFVFNRTDGNNWEKSIKKCNLIFFKFSIKADFIRKWDKNWRETKSRRSKSSRQIRVKIGRAATKPFNIGAGRKRDATTTSNTDFNYNHRWYGDTYE